MIKLNSLKLFNPFPTRPYIYAIEIDMLNEIPSQTPQKICLVHRIVRVTSLILIVSPTKIRYKKWFWGGC